jgi:DtxR family Mn-dependent transcriptional regulator
MTDPLSASLEDYLEAILTLVESEGEAHVKDIAQSLDVAMPSVTGALRGLAGRALVNYRPYGPVTLTRQGRRAAEGVRQRHALLTAFLADILGLDGERAEENACRIEHVVDDVVLDRLAAYLEFARLCPLNAARWEGAFGRFCNSEPGSDECEKRLREALARITSKREAS